MIKTIIYTLILLAVVGGGFYAYDQFIVTTPSEDALVAEEGQAGGIEGSAEVRELLRILQTLRGLSIETQIFEDAAYRNLNDYSVPVEAQPQGRANPFAAF